MEGKGSAYKIRERIKRGILGIFMIGEKVKEWAYRLGFGLSYPFQILYIIFKERDKWGRY